MATKDVVQIPVYSDNVRVFKWEGLATGDVGQPLELMDFADYSVQFAGTFAGGSTATLKGSIDGAAYYTLTDAQGTSISKTAVGFEQVTEAARYVRPEVASGAADSVDVYIYARRNRR